MAILPWIHPWMQVISKVPIGNAGHNNDLGVGGEVDECEVKTLPLFGPEHGTQMSSLRLSCSHFC